MFAFTVNTKSLFCLGPQDGVFVSRALPLMSRVEAVPSRFRFHVPLLSFFHIHHVQALEVLTDAPKLTDHHRQRLPPTAFLRGYRCLPPVGRVWYPSDGPGPRTPGL